MSAAWAESAADDLAAEHQHIVDVLIDCMTSFDINGWAAKEAAEYILSADSGLTVAVRL